MTPEETKQAAAVMLASETKNIEKRYRHGKSDDGWVDCPDRDWDWDSFDYRIAPEPMDVEVWAHEDGRIRERKYWPDIAVGEYQSYTIRRATIHPETK